MKKIALLMAMEGEAMPLVGELGLRPYPLPPALAQYPFRWFSGVCRGLDLRLAIAGKDRRDGVDHIGLEPAAVGAFALIQDFHPALVVNAGTAGSFASRGGTIGKVFLSDRELYFHDHRIPLDGFELYGRGRISAHDTRALAVALELPIGVVSSGSSLDYTARDLEIFEENGGVLKEMEAAAIARVCQWAGVPFFAVKAVTNLIDSGRPSAAEFTRNFQRAVAALTIETRRVIDYLAAHPGVC